jgi:hypothetical protein
MNFVVMVVAAKTNDTVGPGIVEAFRALSSVYTAYWASRLGRLGSLISRSAIARSAALRRLDDHDQQPGRLYSFIAIKPR